MPKHDGSSNRGYRFQAPPPHPVLQAPDGAPRLTSDEGPGLVAAKPQNAGHGKDCLHWPLTGLPGLRRKGPPAANSYWLPSKSSLRASQMRAHE
jgi:hypothetical protein